MNELIARRHRLLVAITAGLVLVGAGPLAQGGAGSTADRGTLALSARLAMRAEEIGCPPGTRSSLCYGREGSGVVRGLGNVSESYTYPVAANAEGCPATEPYRILSYTVRFLVAGKGEIEAAIPGSTDCLSPASVLNPKPLPFTITGGSGAYAGASGTGTLTHAARITGTGRAAGIDTWVGTLIVPGLDFDVTEPVLSGAVGKSVLAPRGVKRVRVTYEVTARDEVDGLVRVSCRPRSGSRFKIGRTVVTCSAADTSGNTRTARFSVRVKPRR